MKDLIEESIVSNCDVRYEIDDKSNKYELNSNVWVS